MTVDDLTVLLRAREAELSAIYANVPGIVFYIALEEGGEFRFVSVSHDFLVATGLSRQQVVGSPVRDVIPPPSRETVLKHYRDAIRSGQPVRWEEESVYPAGRRYGEVAVTPLYDASGTATHLIGIVHDITERKQVEEALRTSEEKFAKAFNNNLSAVAMTRLEDGVFVEVNDTWAKLVGYTREEMIGNSARRMNIYPAPEVAAQFVKELREKGSLQGWERELLKKSGEPFVAELSAQVLTVKGEKLILTTLFDVTARKQAEKALRESESNFRALFQHSPDAVFITVPDGRILAANPAACAMFGMSESDFRLSGREGLVDRDDPRYIPALEKRQRAGFVAKTELTFIRRSGERFPGEVDSVIVPGTPSKSFVIVRDITARKRAEEALLRTEKLASVGRMAATVAHEINNPLEGVTNALYLAKGTKGLPELAREYLEIADSELDRVAHIARQSLGFYRESNAPSVVSINMVLESVLDLLRNRIQAKNATVNKRWEDNVCLTAVGGELRQVFSNLLTNSLDAIERNGTIILRVSTAVVHKNQRCVRVTISDNGKGVDANFRSQIFEPFFTTKGTIGTGLGLWVSKQIVDKHGGTIRVRSTTRGPRKGTTISVLLPDTQSQMASLGAPRSAAGIRKLPESDAHYSGLSHEKDQTTRARSGRV